MNDELEYLWKEAVVDNSRYNPDIDLEILTVAKKAPVRIAFLMADDPTEYLSNKSHPSPSSVYSVYSLL